ncbi:putative protein SZT2, von Willebrand factor-like domain superfamily [Plasmopara halstedii]
MEQSTLHSAPPCVEELILSGSDINVLNRTALSLWHFRQMVVELVPSVAASVDPEEDHSLRSPDKVVAPYPNRGIELGEGMNVAAVLYKEDKKALDIGKKSVDAELSEDHRNWIDRPTLRQQGKTTHIVGRLTPNTRVSAVFERYRCVLCLDASPSILSIDPSSGRLFLDLLYESVELFIWSMLRPMEIGGEAFTPEIHVSVLVQGALVESLCVLMQGYIVTPLNALKFLQLIKERLQLIENDWALLTQKRGQWGYLGNATPASLDWILQNVVFALNSLPTDCTPMMVLVTDGVVDVRDVYSYDNLLMQLVRHDVQCHFLRIGGGDEDELNLTFGFVPDTHLLRFVAEYTGGTVFNYAALCEACYATTSISSNVVQKMTDLQDACFVRKSSVHANSAPVVKLNEMNSTSFDKRTLLPLRPYRMWRDKVHEYRIFADVNRIVEARFREGFLINKVYVRNYHQPLVTDKGTIDSPGSNNTAPSNESTKILIVFLLQWKENVWIEYVVSSTTDNSATQAGSAGTIPHLGRRSSGQGMRGMSSSFSTRKVSTIVSKDQKAAWREWHVKMNILAYADFLRAFKDAIQRSPVGTDRGGSSRDSSGKISLSSPHFVQDFIRNVQDVDRVLLHLMTATASINESNDSCASQFSFGTSTSVDSVSRTSKITSSHPVFNIIGELSTVLWHRWFTVERLEILCIVKSDACADYFYKNELHNAVEGGNQSSLLDTLKITSHRAIHTNGVNVYGMSNGHISIGVESLAEPLMAILVKWSSQKLSRDLFLKFLPPTFSDKGHAHPRNKASPASATTSGGVAQRRRQRSHTGMSAEDAGNGDNNTSTSESNGALCFVRLEVKNKTLCTVNVAFFATRSSTRRRVLNDLKSTIFAGINEGPGTLSPAKLLPPLPAEVSVILCHRMLSRLLVTHDTLLLHELDQTSDSFDYYTASPSLGSEKDAGAVPFSSKCCGGSEMQLQRVFGAYVWHSSWKWEVANLQTLLDVMRRLHDARISCGFWVLDWKMDECDGGQSIHAESVIFGREILMEDEKGHTKTALVQYALRRVSDTCLMTSFWMEPQHGTVKTQLSNEVGHHDTLHWSLKQAIGHSMPFERYESYSAHQTSIARASTLVPIPSPSPENAEHKPLTPENVSSGWLKSSTYLGESELLHLIRNYFIESDCHLLSCLYTFDCIMNLRENIEMSNALSKNAGCVVGSSWNMDRIMAAENGMILPPFSTARLLSSSKRSSQHFLMYLQSGKSSMRAENTPLAEAVPAVSTANVNLYSMLELTLRGLSDCEVAWTDYNGDVVADSSSTSNLKEADQFYSVGMNSQLPLWLKNHMNLSLQKSVPHHALSKGRCFAKLVSDDCVVLAFFPSLDTLQVRNKGAFIGENDKGMSSTASEKKEVPENPAQMFSAYESEQGKSNPHNVRMSVSADDIVLYQERRRNFRESYKSWRMGHFQGSRDEKQSYGRDFRKLRLPSMPEDHEFCEDVSRRTSYGCDFHLLIESSGGHLGSGFFQVAFYECSLSQLAKSVHDDSSETLDCVDLPHTIIKQLFTERRHKSRDERPTVHLDRGGIWRKASERTSLESNESSHFRLSSETALASHRFRKKVKRAHEHNFSRGVYMALRDGGTVQHSDLLQALSSCVEVPTDIDITLLYRMMETAAAHKFRSLSPATAVVSAGVGAEILQEKLNKSFETILSSIFVPIPGTRYYYYTGSENTSYDDVTGTEYELHVLMEELDDGDGDAYTEHNKNDEDRSVVATNITKSIDTSCLDAEVRGDAESTRRKHGSSKEEVSIPIVTSTKDNLESEHYEVNVDEDAEFNKEVAVATSSFSVPFFLKFECLFQNSSREIRSNSADALADKVIADSEMLLDTTAHGDLQKAMATHEYLSSPSSRRKEFNAFLESLRTSQSFNSIDVTRIAESFTKVPSGRIVLRLITLTLQNEQSVNGGRQMPFEIDSSRQAGKTNGLRSVRSRSYSLLHLFQRQVLARVRNDIKEWCSMEILSILRAANEITPAIGGLVQRLFDDLPKHAVTEAKFPLDFVSHSQATPVNPLDLFKCELEKGDLLNVQFCNGVYFVVKNKKVSGEGDNHSDTRIEIPFWAYFEVEADHVCLHYHHADQLRPSRNECNRLDVLTRLQLGVRAACHRVNQYLLLLQLHETRTCNGLLLPADGNLPSSPHSPKRRGGSQGDLIQSNGQGNQSNFFWPGQFECDLCYSAIFKLHERLAPNFALNMLCTSALEQFQVHNRRHMFVYRDRDGRVFYMKISIFYDTNISPDLGTQTFEERQERQERNSIARSNTGGINNAGLTNSLPATVPSGAPCIRLEVFGVSDAGEEVTHELCRLLERKLDEGTQVVLMKLLARNTKFQLSPTDLAFLCPPKAEPISTVDYILPAKVADWCTLLHYLSQTLKLTPYIRPVTIGESLRFRNSRDTANLDTRRVNLIPASSTFGLIDEEVPKTTDQNTHERIFLHDGAKALSSQDSAHIHPACFGIHQKSWADLQKCLSSADAATRSPVFFFKRPNEESGSSFNDSASGPEIIAQASYVLNLNPDLRLSQGFLSRVGKGLALTRIDLIRSTSLEKYLGDEVKRSSSRTKRMHDIPGLGDLYSDDTLSEDASAITQYVVRCQIWIRGSLHAKEVSQIMETFLDEALYDLHLEAIIKRFQSCGANSAEATCISDLERRMPADVNTLVTLLKSASQLPSSSVTCLGMNVNVAPWDLENGIAQIQTFLNCLPSHLRPAIYAKSRRTGTYECANRHTYSLQNEPPPLKFRLVAKHTDMPENCDDADSSDSDTETVATVSSALQHIEPLMRADSVHSETSEMDSVSGRATFAWTSAGASSDLSLISQVPTALSASSTNSSTVGVMAGLTNRPHLLNKGTFTERDVLLYPSSSNSFHRHHQLLTSCEHGEIKRSLFYVVDLSTNKGLRFLGYNMSSALVEALATQLARLLTWNSLREKLLRSLLLEKVGLSAAAPLGAVVSQPRNLFVTFGKTEQIGKGVSQNPVAFCKDSAVHFIDYEAPVLSVLQSNERFPQVLDPSHLRSIDGTALGVYLREAQAQPTIEALDPQYARPRGRSNTNLSGSIGSSGISDLTRDVPGQSLSQQSSLGIGDAPTNLFPFGTSRSGIVSSSNVMNSMTSSPSNQMINSSAALPNPSGDRGETTARILGGGKSGAATALMAARARARGGNSFANNRMGGKPAVNAGNRDPRDPSAFTIVSTEDKIAPWDLPLTNKKGSKSHILENEVESKADKSRDGISPTVSHAQHFTGSEKVANTGLKSTPSGAIRHVRRGSRNLSSSMIGLTASSSSLSELTSLTASTHRRLNDDASLLYQGRVRTSWKKKLKCVWRPRFLFCSHTKRWEMNVTDCRPFQELEEDENQLNKKHSPLQFYCAVFQKRWEAYETQSISHTVDMKLLQKLASLRAEEELEEPISNDIVESLIESGHTLLHQRFRAAFVERWETAEIIRCVPDSDDAGVLHALQSCMELIHLLSYKREFVFDEDDCAVAKLYTEHTVLSMDASIGADICTIKQQVATNLMPLRLKVVREFYNEYIVHLRTLGFRRLWTLTAGSHARACSDVSNAATAVHEVSGEGGFSAYFYHSERALEKMDCWNLGTNHPNLESASIVVLKVICDNQGMLLNAVLISTNDLKQQDMCLQHHLARNAGQNGIGVSGAELQRVTSWLRAQLQTQALIYGFTIRYFQQHLLQWLGALYKYRQRDNGQSQTAGKPLRENDTLAETPPLIWKKISTFQNIVKGLQCFLEAFPNPPETFKAFTMSSPATIYTGNKLTTTKLAETEARENDNNCLALRSVMHSRRSSTKQFHHQPSISSASSEIDCAAKSTLPLSMLWRDCVLRMITLTLPNSLLQSNCSRLIMLQILLRYIACHGSRYKVIDLLQFGTPDTIACHSITGSFFRRPPNATPSTHGCLGNNSSGYSLIITTQPVAYKPRDKNSLQLLLLRSAPTESGSVMEVLPVEGALEEAQLFTRELFRVAAQHYERDLLWSRLLYDNSRDPGFDIAHKLALPSDLFCVEVGPQQLEECLRFSICTPLEALDPRLDELLRVSDVCWQELALRLRDIYADQLREFQFQEENEKSNHLLLLCPNAFDLIIHLTFISPKDSERQGDDRIVRGNKYDCIDCLSQSDDSLVSSSNELFKKSDLRMEICRREEPSNKQFTFAQRRSISEFVNSIVHWQWRSLIYD